jgi:hypothetical protein
MVRGELFTAMRANSACFQYEGFVAALRAHADDAYDERFRQLCLRTLPRAEACETMLKEYRDTLKPLPENGLTKWLGNILEVVQELTDLPRCSDIERLEGDIAMARQAGETFRLFQEGGLQLNLPAMEEVGEFGHRVQNEYLYAAEKLHQDFFVERARSRQSEEPLPAT